MLFLTGAARLILMALCIHNVAAEVVLNPIQETPSDYQRLLHLNIITSTFCYLSICLRTYDRSFFKYISVIYCIFDDRFVSQTFASHFQI